MLRLRDLLNTTKDLCVQAAPALVSIVVQHRNLPLGNLEKLVGQGGVPRKNLRRKLAGLRYQPFLLLLAFPAVVCFSSPAFRLQSLPLRHPIGFSTRLREDGLGASFEIGLYSSHTMTT